MGTTVQKWGLGLVLGIVIAYVAYMAYQAGGITPLVDKIRQGALR